MSTYRAADDRKFGNVIDRETRKPISGHKVATEGMTLDATANVAVRFLIFSAKPARRSATRIIDVRPKISVAPCAIKREQQVKRQSTYRREVILLFIAKLKDRGAPPTTSVGWDFSALTSAGVILRPPVQKTID